MLRNSKVTWDHISPFFMTNQKNLKCEVNNPLILIPEKKISNLNVVVRVHELALKRQRCVVIVAEEVESDALATLILNKLLARIKLQRKSQMVQNELVRLGERITKALSMELCHEFEDKFL
ncbi:chaperonin CPN60-2, mitochondrial-like isoform X2 [Olea europaea var. sylvestris]|uniref:chaperonin CPN60-2, mitochondrial-like isoform X2 n=1 Tax=Olea europaea var. sylvestris TaxID=158386 RepID=UPI000C1CE1A0|nr:chaperonin CPN60-2, mitochondrial-like isoform X2 [Olea europaea var. sylvestris]XP_022858111.1 chaperonin CPN60-2, mitochondrial-like isoform X2 [Olea europaea var. sylvestris]XP_022858112.1 chaperonin CPN60-2, mitochondrial-like isoform X2 [Olea europaea var. sylvestris]XP_022858113.1 chaperonin CPN60-2, mitochondrial-like isoform X2 [Olea europaea var. sylvestris]XP_022858114.1 chaperonin CPN60-2, mitochondrial-like isoform X2 [Olea europaea var. sylvestris]XP_022858115.1 chaperonin CPN6